MPKATMHRVECLDCGKIATRMIYVDIPVHCRQCGSANLLWRPAA